ncbi:MAG: peptidyl-tRNA hydrolase Pth2 [Candidatus Diapherotrites archaeon]
MEMKQVIVVRTDLGMGRGKIAAQSAHAAIQAMFETKKKFPDYVDAWMGSGMPKVVLKVSSLKEMMSLFQKMKQTLPCAVISDAGRTQIKAGTKTCFGCGPVVASEIDPFIKDMKLL